MGSRSAAGQLVGCAHSLVMELGAVELSRVSRSATVGRSYPLGEPLPAPPPTLSIWPMCGKGDRVSPDHPQYCGETGKSVEERFCGHRNTITQHCHSNTTLPVGEHFRLPGHSVADLVFTPVERIYSSNVFVRKVREKLLIYRLDLIENGLNKKL